MNFRYVSTFLFLTSISISGNAWAGKKSDKNVEKQLRADIGYLASDELEGRRTGTEGEKKAADYIEKRYKKLEIQGYNGQYKYTFQFTYGKKMGNSSKVVINNETLSFPKDGFVLPFSATKQVSGDVIPDVTEHGKIWFINIFSDTDQATDPHFDADKKMYELAKDAEKEGATGVLFYDAIGAKYEPEFNKHSEYDALSIPVIFLNNEGYKKSSMASKADASVQMVASISKTERQGTNLAAYIDNHAPYTVILGAHYDHLGFGEDGNSLHANASKEHQIHHGADDNASGTAAILELANRIKKNKLTNYNYLFLHFSGEELGLFGSKSFVKDQHIDSSKIAYMINLDMVGRLNDSTHALTLGGVGTSPAWSKVVEMGNEDFKLVIDSSGIGPSDHTSFYYANIPVLFLFSGTHKDYHKPTDIAAYINYKGEASIINYVENIVDYMDEAKTKPAFTTTKQSTVGKVRFKVTLGIMPDYSYQDGGVRVDGVSDDRPAAKAGVKRGDIILQLGNYKIQSMQSYMEALGKFTPGEKTTLIVKRDNNEISLPIELNK